MVNGDSKIHVCTLDEYEFKYSTEEFYKHIDNWFQIYKIANGIDPDTPEYQKNLVYAKAIEIREDYINRVMKQSAWPNWTQCHENKPFSAHVWLKNPVKSRICGLRASKVAINGNVFRVKTEISFYEICDRRI